MLLLTDSTDFYFTLHICTIHKSVLRTSVRISSIDSQKHTYLDYDWYLYRKSCGKISFELQINRRCTPVKFNLAFSWREKKLKKFQFGSNMQGQWNQSKIGCTNFNLRPFYWECKNCLFPFKAKILGVQINI